jgi:hypothetical protein
MSVRKCVNPKCDVMFEPDYPSHIWHSGPCRHWVMREEIGASACGMQPLGMMGDAKKIKAFDRKWAREAARGIA